MEVRNYKVSCTLTTVQIHFPFRLFFYFSQLSLRNMLFIIKQKIYILFYHFPSIRAVTYFLVCHFSGISCIRYETPLLISLLSSFELLRTMCCSFTASDTRNLTCVLRWKNRNLTIILLLKYIMYIVTWQFPASVL